MKTALRTTLKLTSLALTAAATFALSPAAQAQQPPGPGGPHAEHRDDGPGRGGDRRYDFRDSDRDKLRQHYSKDLKRVDRGHRPDFRPGQPVPQDFRGRIKPVPANVRRGLPPPPQGYQMGYYDGYTVVYDPVSFTILQVLDILR